jgi:hypothetical protein
VASLFEYANWVQQLTRAQFASKYVHPFLLRKEATEATDGLWSFDTKTLTVSGLTRSLIASADHKPLPAELARYEVLPVTKSLENPWPDRISVGRVRNNDIVLAETSVSKLHAHFLPQSDGGMLLADVGSVNGTRVNGVRVTNEPRRVQSEDVVTFGAIVLTFLDAGSLYDLVAGILANQPSSES